MRGLPLLFFYEHVARSYLCEKSHSILEYSRIPFSSRTLRASRWHPASIVVGINNRYRSPQPGTRDIVMADFYPPPNEQSRPFATVISVLSLSLIIRCLSWENFFSEYHEGGCLSASSISNGSSQKPQRQNTRSTSVEPGRRRSEISGQLRCHLFALLPFSPASPVLFSLPASSIHVHFIVPVGGGRPSLIESAVLYLLGPPQPFVCFSPISVASLPFFNLSLSLFLVSPLINLVPATCNPPLSDRDRVLIISEWNSSCNYLGTRLASFIVR